MLKKEYSEEEIRKMSEYNRYQGWSVLSRLVMQIQGIGYEQFSSSYPYRREYKCDAKRLVDINSALYFECFMLSEDSTIESMYIPQIFEVFENLTFYKVEEYSKKQIREKLENAKREIEQFISQKTLTAISSDIEYSLAKVKTVTERLNELQKLFTEKGYRLTHNLFENANSEILKQIYEERETKITLEKID